MFAPVCRESCWAYRSKNMAYGLKASEVGTSANRSTNPQIADSSFYLRICETNFLPQTNRQCCLIRGKTARKKWTLLFSGLEVDDRKLMTFFFFGGQRLVDGKI